MRSAACLLLLCLLAAFVSHAGEMTAVDPLDEEWALREAQEQQRVEIMEALLRWRQEGLVRRAMNNKKCAEAEEAEIEAIAHADRSFDERDYRKARERYRKALRIRFTQWAPTGAPTAGEEKDKDAIPPFTERTFRLATHRTRWIYKRLAQLDQIIPEADLHSLQAESDESLEADKLATAYRRYGELIANAARLPSNAAVRKAADHARAQRVAIVETVSKPLEAARAALEANRPDKAVESLNRFQRQYGYFTVNKTVNHLYRKLAADPRVAQARRELAAAQLLELGKAALTRGDYATAKRRFETVSRTYAKTAADSEAKERVDALLADDVLVELIRIQEAESECTALLARARMQLRQGQPAEALAVFERIMKEYPKTPWATEAARLSRSLRKKMRETDMTPASRSKETQPPTANE